MSNSAENPPSLDSLEEDSDELIELTDEVLGESDSGELDELALVMPVFKVPNSSVSHDSVVDESEAEVESEDFDREELVRTVRMEAFDRSKIELLDSVRKWNVHEFLTDQRYAPDILVLPPRVLTKKWLDGMPKDPSSFDEDRSVAATVKTKGLTEDDIDRGLSQEQEPRARKDEAIELDSEALEEAVMPPPKPAAPPKVTRQPSRERKDTKPLPREPTPTPRQVAEDDDLSGIVKELLAESKQDAPKKTPAELKRENWFIDVFSEEYLRTLPKDLHKQTQRDVQFIKESLAVKPGARIFDLACGFGRHSIQLAKQDFEVAGLDSSMALLQRALSEAQRRSLSIKFIHGDMRELSFREIFDACFMWQTSFGYFDDKTNFNVLKGVHRALKQGGRFLLDVVNRDYVVAEMPSRTWWEGIECVFLEEVEFDFDTSVLHTKRSFIYEDGSPPQEFSSYVRLYGLHELRQILRIAGFDVLEVSGEVHQRGAYLGPASSRSIVLAEKR